ncbi:hypothetical protein F0562_032767 [Nyssa sinensis]|uniref:Amino acid transporter transmembrane domain-containing protein n=1 Tax=Nyssa sinensis TaxID=561372 RepID=A0A5J5AQW5_9ASTE|nr:hypothetical protein F0562_032767 [Nyssa sinensis]
MSNHRLEQVENELGSLAAGQKELQQAMRASEERLLKHMENMFACFSTHSGGHDDDAESSCGPYRSPSGGIEALLHPKSRSWTFHAMMTWKIQPCGFVRWSNSSNSNARKRDVTTNLKIAQERMRKYYDEKRMERTFQMIQLHECVSGIRFDRYYDLGRHAFGPKLGPWIVLPQQLIVQIFVHKLNDLDNRFSGLIIHTVIKWGSDCSFSTVVWVGCLSRGQIENVSYAYKKTSGADYMFRVFNALVQISFAYAGHAVVLEIQATIPSTPEKPSKVPMWKGSVGAYFIHAICYFPVSLIGHWAMGQDV